MAAFLADECFVARPNEEIIAFVLPSHLGFGVTLND
jgi:hypothetical protein